MTTAQADRLEREALRAVLGETKLYELASAAMPGWQDFQETYLLFEHFFGDGGTSTNEIGRFRIGGLRQAAVLLHWNRVMHQRYKKDGGRFNKTLHVYLMVETGEHRAKWIDCETGEVLSSIRTYRTERPEAVKEAA